MILALCNICHAPVLIDSGTGNKLDPGTEQGHRHKSKAKFVPGQYSSEQIAEMNKNEIKGYCDSCRHTFQKFSDAFEHMMKAEGSHPVHAIK